MGKKLFGGYMPFHILKAPKKYLIVFEESGHLACFEEEDKFNELMTRQVLSHS